MSITVTATPTGASGATLRVLVLTGATEAGGASAHPTGNTGGHVSITPNGSNSFIAWSNNNAGSNGAFTSLANNTILDNIATTGGQRMATGYYSGTVTSGSAVSAGATGASSPTTTSAYEILASGGSTPSIDASSPSVVDETSGSSALTTGSFAPPGSAVLVAIVTGAAFPSAWTVSDSSSLTWTKRVDNTDGQHVWTATTASSGTSVSGAVATAALAAPAGSVTAGATVAGAAATAALAAPAGTVSAGAVVSGAVATVALAAPAGSPLVSITVPGAVAPLALAAPAGSVTAGATIAGAVAPLALAAPAGAAGAATAVAGAVAPLALAAPAGTVRAGATVAGAVATAALAAPAGTMTGGRVTAAFPPGPLDLVYELLINGSWTDISTYVYQRADQQIARGHQDESTTTNPSTLGLTLDNRDGRFSSKNPTGPYYPYLGRNTQLRTSVPEGASYLRIEDDSTSYAQAPDSSGLSITGDTDIQIDLTLDNWQGDQMLAAKWAETGNERSWVFYLQGGILHFGASSGGSSSLNTNNAGGPVPVPGLRRQCVRITFASSTGTVIFYTSPSPLSSAVWTQVGSTTVWGSLTIFNSTAPVQVGYCSDAASVGLDGVNGKVHAFSLLSGILGTAKASPDFTTQTAGASSFTDAQSNTWTMEGTSEISDRRYRMHGEAAGWPQAWDPTGGDVWVDLAVAGILQRLTAGAASRPLQSAFRRALPSAVGLVGYWPSEDGNDQTGAGATPATPTQIASAVQGVRAGTFTGSPQFASNSAFLCSYPLPSLNKSRWHFRLPSRAPDTANIFRFLMQMPSSGDTNNGVIARMYTAGTVAMLDLVYTTGGNLTLNGYDQSGNALFSDGPAAFAVNGELLYVSVELQASGSNVAYSAVTLLPGADTGSAISSTVAGHIGNASELVINGNIGTAALDGAAVGHITYQDTWVSLFEFGAQLDAWIGEAAGNRFQRLCAEQGIPFRYRGDLDDTTLMGAQTPLDLPSLLQECVDADQGQFWEPRQCPVSLGYRTRASMQNQAPGVTIDYSLKQLAADPAPSTTEDDQNTINDAVVVNSYTGGSAEVMVTSGPLSVNDPPAGVGYYQQAPQINLASDSQCQDLAGWITWLGTVDEPRYPALTVNLARTETASIYDDVQELDLGDRLVIINTPPWLPPDGISQIVQATAETLNAFSYVITWTGVPESPYETGVVADPLYAQADTDGSTLHANITTTATSLQLDTTAASPTYLWSTASADRPFDILISGERMTVTALTGTSSPQSATVTRSVNGVVKAHSAGEAVTLFYPTVLSL